MEIKSLRETAGAMTMVSAWAPTGRSVINHTTFENGAVSCVLGINGRGSLQCTETEFFEYAAAIAEAVRVLRGGEPSDQD